MGCQVPKCGAGGQGCCSHAPLLHAAPPHPRGRVCKSGSWFEGGKCGCSDGWVVGAMGVATMGGVQVAKCGAVAYVILRCLRAQGFPSALHARRLRWLRGRRGWQGSRVHCMPVGFAGFGGCVCHVSSKVPECTTCPLASWASGAACATCHLGFPSALHARRLRGLCGLRVPRVIQGSRVHCTPSGFVGFVGCVCHVACP